MTNILAVIFDQGNVLDSHKESDKDLAEATGLSPEEFGQYAKPHVRELHLGLDELEFLNRVRKDAGKNPTTERIFRKIYRSKRPLNYELLDINFQLRRLGFKTGIISNAERPLQEFLEEKEEGAYLGRFDVVVFSCDAGLVKPDREIYLLGCERLGVQPANAVFIDDSLRNVQAFQELGGYGIWHNKNQKTVQELSRLLGHELVLRE